MTELLDNRYEIIRRLGSGGMADVYLARDTQLGRQVAIKVLYKRYARDEEFVARFRREAQSAAALNHPHIVSIYDRGEADDSYYIAMEYLEGQSLKDVIIEEGPLAPARAIEYAEQILQALKFAHEHNVIHRDIKPHNIVINGHGQVKVTDFGIARAGSSPSVTETGSIIGTAQYLSPEQAKGKAVEQSSDLYSLGVVLYEMLTGRVPFEGENPVAIALKHLSDEPVPPQALVPEIPDNLNAVVMRALAKDPLDRYPGAGEFLADLERCRQDLPVVAPPPSADTAMTSVIPAAGLAAMEDETGRTAVMSRGAGTPPDKKDNRRKWLYAALALATLIALAAGVYFLAFAQNRGNIDVPDVVGLERAQAEDLIRAQNLVPELDAEEFSESVPAGRVVRQNPEKGARLKEGGTVRLIISRGSSKVAVPELRGQTASYADSKLKEAGLTPDRQPDAFSDSVPEGAIINQDPAPGTQVQKGSSVKFVVSKGAEPPKQVQVPDVRNLTVDQALSRLQQAGLTLGTTTEEFSDSVSNGKVISQNPASGQMVDEGQAVNLVVSKGSAPQKVTVPELMGMTPGDAESTVTAKGLVPFVSELTNPDPTTWGHVYNQDPAFGTKVDSGSTVIIYVGKMP